MKNITLLIAGLLVLCGFHLFSQGVAVNESGSPANASAILDVSSNTKGVLIPRMTASERNTLGALNPSEGLLVFDSDSNAFYYYSDAWIRLAGGSLLTTTTTVTISEPLILSGDAIVFEDFRIPASSARAGGAGIPPFSQVTALGNTYQYHFEDISQAQNEQSLYFNIQMPHNYQLGSSIYPHIHWMPSTTGSGNVRWGIEYTWVNIDGTFGTTSTIYGDESINAEQYKHLMTAINSESMNSTGKTGSSMILVRVFRNSSNAADTYTGSGILLEFDFHYRMDRLGDVYVP